MSEQSGQQGEVSDDDLQEAVKELTPAGTQEVADYVGMSRQAAEYRLKQFDEQWNNSVWSKKIGPTRIWMHRHHVVKPGWFEGDTYG